MLSSQLFEKLSITRRELERERAETDRLRWVYAMHIRFYSNSHVFNQALDYAWRETISKLSGAMSVTGKGSWTICDRGMWEKR